MAAVDLETVRAVPLVLLGAVGSADEAREVAAAVAARFATERFITVVAGGGPAILDEVVVGLGSRLAELVTAAGPEGDVEAALALSWRALDELGVGQDFVFTIPSVSDAVSAAVDDVLAADDRHWEGTAVLVIGSAEVAGQARAAALAASRS